MPTTRICAARMIEELRGQPRQREPRILDDDPRHAESRIDGGALGDDRRPRRRAIACGAKSTPSAFSPRSATNTEPGSRAGESCVTPRARHVERRGAGGQLAVARPAASARASACSSSPTVMARRRDGACRRARASEPERGDRAALDRTAGRGILLDARSRRRAGARSCPSRASIRSASRAPRPRRSGKSARGSA